MWQSKCESKEFIAVSRINKHVLGKYCFGGCKITGGKEFCVSKWVGPDSKQKTKTLEKLKITT